MSPRYDPELKEAAAAMAAAGLTQREAARRLGVPVTALRRWRIDWPRGRHLRRAR